MLSQHDIHEIISQISQSLNCPECNTRIMPHNITITDVVDKDCMFDVSCHRCSTEMTLSAHVEKNATPDSMTHNFSSQIMHNGFLEEPISEEDVRSIQYELKNFCGSFIEAFAR
ncbi:hypothetical protein IPJ72_03780 [Candidatus Peregrinibacteria bacterium]|nr:MAG: hypothetical protein IPJ72_03780 [Candidatus Peregrinibacteria bacterium]